MLVTRPVAIKDTTLEYLQGELGSMWRLHRTGIIPAQTLHEYVGYWLDARERCQDFTRQIPRHTGS